MTTKKVKAKSMLKASTKLPTSGMVGGVANDHPHNQNEKKSGKVGGLRGK